MQQQNQWIQNGSDTKCSKIDDDDDDDDGDDDDDDTRQRMSIENTIEPMNQTGKRSSMK